MADPTWWKDFEKSFNFPDSRYLGVLKVVDYETEIRFFKSKMADPI